MTAILLRARLVVLVHPGPPFVHLCVGSLTQSLCRAAVQEQPRESSCHAASKRTRAILSARRRLSTRIHRRERHRSHPKGRDHPPLYRQRLRHDRGAEAHGIPRRFQCAVAALPRQSYRKKPNMLRKRFWTCAIRDGRVDRTLARRFLAKLRVANSRPTQSIFTMTAHSSGERSARLASA